MQTQNKPSKQTNKDINKQTTQIKQTQITSTLDKKNIDKYR